MAKLEITVETKGAGGAQGAGFTAAEAERIQRSLEQSQRLQSVLLRGSSQFARGLLDAVQGLDRKLASMEQGQQGSFSRLALGLQRSLEQAGQKGGAAAGAAATKSFEANFQPLKAGLASGARTLAAAFSRFGAEASSAFGVAFSGGLLSGGPLKGAGGLLAAGARLGGDLGKAIAQGLGGGLDLIPKVGPILGGVAKALGAALSVAGSLAGVIATAAGEIAGALGDALGSALKVTLGAAVAVGVLGIRQALREGNIAGEFEKLAKASGDSAASGLEKLRTATKGTISDFELMRLATLAVREGVSVGVDDFGKLAETARELGKGVNVDAVPAIENMIRGVGQLSARQLNLLGLTVEENQTYEKLAATLGVQASALTEAQKKTALLSVVTTEAQARIKDTGADVVDASDRLDRFAATTSNASGAVGRALVPALDRLLTNLDPVVASLGRFIDRTTAAASADLAGKLDATAEPFKRIADFVDRAKLDDVFRLGAKAAGVFFDYLEKRAVSLGDRLALEVSQAFAKSASKAQSKIPFADFADFMTTRGALAHGKTSREISDDLLGAERSAELNRIENQNRLAGGQLDQGLAGLRSDFGDVLQRPSLVPPADSRPASRPFRQEEIAPRGRQSAAYFQAPAPRERFANAAAFTISNNLADSTAAGSIVKLIPILNEIGAAVERAPDPAKALERATAQARDRVEQSRIDEKIDGLLSPLERSFKNGESFARDLDREIDKSGDAINGALAKMSQLGDDLKRGMDAINRDFDRKVASIESARDSRVAAATGRRDARADELASLSGGLGADQTSIPPKLRRAAAKVRKQANKDRRDSLRQLSDTGETTDELAAGGGARLKAIFAQQAEVETGASREIAQAFADAATQLQAAAKEKIAATNELRDAIEKDRAEQSKLIADETAAIRSMIVALEKTRADNDKLEKELDNLKRAVGALK